MGETPTVEDTEQMRLTADIAQSQEDRYNKVFAPIEKMLIAETIAFKDRGAKFGAAAGSFGKARGTGIGLLEKQPLGAGTTAKLGGFEAETAGGAGLGLAEADTDLESGRLKAIGDLTTRGRGEARQANAGLNASANLATERAIYNAKLNAEKAANRMKAYGGIAGAAGRAYAGGGGFGGGNGLGSGAEGWDAGMADSFNMGGGGSTAQWNFGPSSNTDWGL